MDIIQWAEDSLLYKTRAIHEGVTVIAVAFCKCHGYEFQGIADTAEDALINIMKKYRIRHGVLEEERKANAKRFDRKKEMEERR